MRLRNLLIVALGALALAACDDDDATAPPVATTTQIAEGLIASSTTETGQAIEINALEISDADSDDTLSPGAI